MEFFNALFSAALDQNIVFGQLVGMVIVFLAAERPQDAFRLGGALWAACFAAGLIGWPVYAGILAPWGIDYMAPVVYLLVSAAVIFAGGAIAAASRARAERSRISGQSSLKISSTMTAATPNRASKIFPIASSFLLQ